MPGSRPTAADIRRRTALPTVAASAGGTPGISAWAARAVGNAALTVGADHWHRDGSWVALVFHHLTDGRRWRADDPFLAGLGIDMAADQFAARIDALATRYEIVGLDQALAPRPKGRRRRLLLCFDDAYATVAELAAPILAERGLQWCLFLNPSVVGNHTLALDNLVVYVANTFGLGPLADAADAIVDSPNSLLRGYLAGCTPAERRQFGVRLAESVDVDPAALAGAARLYLEASDVRALADAGVEIGNHTAEHVSCRMLDDESVVEQVIRSATAITRLSGKPVRSFAYPYGSLIDATPLVTERLRASGHESAFVVEGRHNADHTDRFRLHRVALCGGDDASNAVELAILPRLRTFRARMTARTRR